VILFENNYITNYFMEILNSIILGAVQGLTEFLPVSSSGHLILAREILGLQVVYGLAFDAVLQLATTLAILIYFHKDVIGLCKSAVRFILQKRNNSVSEEDLKQNKMLLAVIVGTIPAVILGLFLEESMDTVFRNPALIVLTLSAGAVIMAFSEKFAKQNREIGPKTGLLIGFFQSLALVPGMSRSGMTIAGGLFVGLKREQAARFSFVLALPVLMGSGLKKLLELGSNNLLQVIGWELLVGALFAFIVGFAAIHFLINFLKTNTLRVFVWYRLILAAVILIFLL
jgi:undecaprenyl-diphosphatase